MKRVLIASLMTVFLSVLFLGIILFNLPLQVFSDVAKGLKVTKYWLLLEWDSFRRSIKRAWRVGR